MRCRTLRTGVLLYILLGGSVCVWAAEPPAETERGSLLYNGIRLPAQWPPRTEPLSREPMPVPYLERPPEVIPVDLGRQLFVDDFLIQETTLRRSFHRARYHLANPVLKADRPWEKQDRAPMRKPFPAETETPGEF